MADSSKRGWRRGSSPTGAGGSAGGKGWQSRRTTAAQSSATSHRAKLVALGVVVIALATYFAMKVFFIPVKTPLAIVSVTQFASPIPPNGYSQEDAALLARVNPENIHTPPSPDSNLTREVFLRFIDEILAGRGGGPTKNVLLVSLSTHGVVNERSEPCLLLSDAGPLDSGTWLPFREITERIKRQPRMQVVLFLDAGKVDSSWPLGILRNDFVSRLEQELSTAEITNLHVFSSISNGQRAWTAPELGSTPFGYFLARGLQGGGKGTSDQITLQELVDYVTAEVSGWAGARRAGAQTPRLLTKPARDLAVAYRGSPSQLAIDSSAGEKQRLQAAWDRLGEAWRLFEQRSREREWPRLEPVATAAMQKSLLRAEALLWSGNAYRGELEELQTSIRTQLETQPSANLPAELTGYSQAWEQFLAAGGTPNAASDEVHEKLVLEKWLAAGGAPKLKEGEPPLPKLRRAAAERVAWRFLRRTPLPPRSGWREAISLIDTAAEDSTNRRVTDTAETLFLRMVDRYLDPDTNAADFSAPTRTALEQVLAIRELAEKTAVPLDERVHYWIQAPMQRADAGRRTFEDRLFCDAGEPPAAPATSGSPPPAQGASTSPPELLAAYDSAQQQASQVAESLALRDEVWGQLPFLAEWLLRADRLTRRTVLGDSGDLPTAAAAISRIAQQNHLLAAKLDQSLTEGTFDAAAVSTATEAVRTDWRRLRDAFVSHSEELKARAGEDRPTWREIEDVLRVPSPLLTSDERSRLMLKYSNILFSEEEAEAGNSPAHTQANGNPVQLIEEAIASEWDAVARHPVLEMIRRDDLSLLLKERTPTGEPAMEAGAEARFATQGAIVRQLSNNLAAALRELEDVTNRRLEEATETSGNLRAGISEADRLCRAAIPFAAVSAPDPAHRLRRVDLHLALLWHASRSLDDFWGATPVSGQTRNDTGKSHYFSLVANHYLQLATRLEDTPKSLLYERDDLRRKLAARENAAQALQLQPADIQTLGGDSAVPQGVRIGWPEALPLPGIAGLFVMASPRDRDPQLTTTRDSEGAIWRRRPVRVGAATTTEFQHQLNLDPKVGQDSQFMATLLFRGHAWRQSFSVLRPTAVLTTTVDPRLPPQAKVTVTGAGSRRAFITFIFDCSRSMEQDGRMAKAKEGFRQVLEAISRDQKYEIGLRVYGRRAGYNSDGTRTFDQNGQATDRDPNTDVELLVPVAPLGDDQYEAILTRIAELKPLGVTPLYLAIKTTLESDDFALARPEDLKHIIVLTDGINEQLGAATTAADVLKTIRTSNRAADVRLDVVLFQEESLRRDQGLQQRLAARTATLEQELSDIKSVAAATGGEYYSAENPAALVDALRRALKLVKYSVVAQGDTEKPTPIELDQDWPVGGLTGQSRNFQVQLHGADRPATQTVILEGGEAVELQYDKSEDQLVFDEYRPRDSREALDGLIDPTTKETYRVLPILPRKNLRRVEFGLAVQNRDRLKFTTRPRHVWAEIQPLDDAEAPVGPSYPFSDTRFAEETPVPVLQFVIADWPEEATKAAVRAWLKFDFPPLKPNGTVVVEELKTVDVEEDIPQVTFQASIQQIGEGKGGWRLRVRERHDPASNLFTSRVQASPPPDQLRHRYFVGVDTVEHEFDYAEKPAPTVIVTSRERITENALVVPRVVMVVKD